jgi:glycerophosphoryl diester phosphodiesterase
VTAPRAARAAALAAAAAAVAAAAACAHPPRPTGDGAPAGAAPLVIAHRGASGHLPEHTLAAYDLAITMGADFVEPDLVSTRDSVLVARHENEIGGTTDAAARFPGRRATRTVDGARVTGWFVEDFTLAELRTLRARERLPGRSHARDGELPVPTFDEVLALVARRAGELGRPVGVYPETKHPEHFRAIGLPLEERLVAALAGPARAAAPGRVPVFVQSFSVASLLRLRPLTAGMPDVRLAQLVRAPGSADDAPPAYASPGALVTPAGLAFVRTYADAVGVDKALVQPADSSGATLPPPTALVRDAHRAGLRVHVWTLRGDAPFLPAAYAGDPRAEWRRFAALGVDGLFGDFPDQGRAAFGPPRAARR